MKYSLLKNKIQLILFLVIIVKTKLIKKSYKNTNKIIIYFSNLTETILETPSSSIVIPYKVSAASIVFLLWVIKIN